MFPSSFSYHQDNIMDEIREEFNRNGIDSELTDEDFWPNKMLLASMAATANTPSPYNSSLLFNNSNQFSPKYNAAPINNSWINGCLQQSPTNPLPSMAAGTTFGSSSYGSLPSLQQLYLQNMWQQSTATAAGSGNKLLENLLYRQLLDMQTNNNLAANLCSIFNTLNIQKREYNANTANSFVEFRPRECGFCKSNKETREFYTSHYLKNSEGHVICPILSKYVCPYCQATGIYAHTKGYCPQKPENDNNNNSVSSSNGNNANYNHNNNCSNGGNGNSVNAAAGTAGSASVGPSSFLYNKFRSSYCREKQIVGPATGASVAGSAAVASAVNPNLMMRDAIFKNIY